MTEQVTATSQQVIVQNIIQQPIAYKVPNPEKRFSWGWCIFWAIVFWPAIIVQVLLYISKPDTITIYR